MTDIVERLRNINGHTAVEVFDWCEEAADEIERLRETLLQVKQDLAICDDREINRVRAEIERLQKQINSVYTERNRLVALIASLYPSGIKKTDIPGWDKEWHGCVYIDLPTGQASWHYHDSEAWMFTHLSRYEAEWDGHTTDEKYYRVGALELKNIMEKIND
jgi:hypothetical protein